MNKEFIPYKQALELKELGFDDKMRFDDIIKPWYHKGILCNNDMYLIPIINEHPRNCYAPLYQQAFRWFREKYEVFNSIYPIGISTGGKDSYRWRWVILGIMEQENVHQDESDIGYLKYEEAELACLKRLIQIAKNK